MCSGAAGSGIQAGKFAHQFAGFIDAGFGFSCPRFCSSPKPLNFGVNQVFQSFLTFRLSVEEFFFLLQELAVAPVHSQQTFGVHAVKFGHVGGNIFEKVAVMAYDHAGKRRLLQQIFEPFNSGEVQMIRRLIEQQDIGRLNQRLHDRQRFCQPPDNEAASSSRSSKPARPKVSAKWVPCSPSAVSERSIALSTTVRTLAPATNIESCST